MYIMEIAKLNSKNFLDYAIQNYRNPECRDIEEFSEDVNRIKYLKRLFSRYDQDNDFKCRLVVNHLIVFSNVFGDVPSCRILFFKVEEMYHHILKTCLEYMNILPDDIPELDISAIPLDIKILKKLETEI
jgi:hypothetical protein